MGHYCQYPRDTVFTWKTFSCLILGCVLQLVLNFERKSTVGWNITNALTDLAGGLLSLSQQVLDAIVMDDASIITGNLAKLGLGLISITYCLLLMFQHYVLYPTRDSALQKFTPLHAGEESASGLLQVNEV